MSYPGIRIVAGRIPAGPFVLAGAVTVGLAVAPSARLSTAVAAAAPPSTVIAHVLKPRPHAAKLGMKVTPNLARAFYGEQGFALADTGNATYPARTSDGGRAWRITGPQLHIDAADGPEGVQDVGIISAQTQYAYGSSVVDTTTNNGRTWYEAFLGQDVAAVVPGANGRLVAFVQNSSNTETQQYVSANGGRVWRLSPRQVVVNEMRASWAAAAVAAGFRASADISSAVDQGATRAASQTRFHTCRASQLTVKLGHSEAGGGTAGADIEFINRSKSICSLSGWPKLVAHAANGGSARAHRFPAADFAGLAVGVNSGQIGVPTVVVRPGRRADAIFAAADGPGAQPCGKPYRTLSVTAPGTIRNAAVSAWIPDLDHFLPSCSQIRLSPVLPSADVYQG